MYITRVSYFLVLVTLSSSQTLTGDYVCHRVENYTVDHVETYTVPSEVFTMEWCLQFPPRCPKRKIELRQETRVKTEVKFRVVDNCCKGYDLRQTEAGKAYCTPHCDKCEHGTCVSPDTCKCNPGYRGIDCSYVCPNGYWGKHCMQQCKCPSNKICHPKNGSCTCLEGWHGTECDEKCPEGYWGLKCENKCSCSTADCNHVTGECPDLVEDSRKDWTNGDTIPITSSTRKNEFLPDSFTVSKPPDDNVAEGTETEIRTNFDMSTSTVGERPTTAKTIAEGDPQNDMRTFLHLDDSDKTRLSEKEPMIPRVFFTPESDFVKNIRKDDSSHPVPIPVDVAVLIVIGAMISLSLTSVAALMIFHMRSRLIKAVRMSVYPADKPEGQHVEPAGATIAPKSAHANTLPRTTPRVSSIVLTSPEPKAVLSLEDSTNEYANGTVTIDIRNLRDLLEGHYDRPTSSFHRNEDHSDHVYDEIPLSTSFCIGKTA